MLVNKMQSPQRHTQICLKSRVLVPLNPLVYHLLNFGFLLGYTVQILSDIQDHAFTRYQWPFQLPRLEVPFLYHICLAHFFWPKLPETSPKMSKPWQIKIPQASLTLNHGKSSQKYQQKSNIPQAWPSLTFQGYVLPSQSSDCASLDGWRVASAEIHHRDAGRAAWQLLWVLWGGPKPPWWISKGQILSKN